MPLFVLGGARSAFERGQRGASSPKPAQTPSGAVHGVTPPSHHFPRCLHDTAAGLCGLPHQRDFPRRRARPCAVPARAAATARGGVRVRAYTCVYGMHCDRQEGANCPCCGSRNHPTARVIITRPRPRVACAHTRTRSGQCANVRAVPRFKSRAMAMAKAVSDASLIVQVTSSPLRTKYWQRAIRSQNTRSKPAKWRGLMPTSEWIY